MSCASLAPLYTRFAPSSQSCLIQLRPSYPNPYQNTRATHEGTEASRKFSAASRKAYLTRPLVHLDPNKTRTMKICRFAPSFHLRLTPFLASLKRLAEGSTQHCDFLGLQWPTGHVVNCPSSMVKRTGYRQESATIPNELKPSVSLEATRLHVSESCTPVWTSKDAGKTLPASWPFRFCMSESYCDMLLPKH